MPGSPILLFNLIGAGFGALLGATALAVPGERQRRNVLFGLLALTGSAAAACITLKHARVPPGADLWRHLESMLALLSGPLLLLLVRAAGGHERPVPSRAFLHFAPTVACAGLALASAVSGRSWQVPIEMLVSIQVSYTAFAAWTYRRDRELGPAAEHGLIRLVLGCFILLHAAQLVRLALRHAPASRAIVPTMLSAGFLLLACGALHRLLRVDRTPVKPCSNQDGDSKPQYVKSPLHPQEAAELLERLGAIMTTRKLYRSPGLTPRALGRALGMTPHALSQLLNRYAGESFAAYVQRLRVEEAGRLLLDPTRANLTVDAIGQEAGFPSRSTFHSAFRRATGMTPAQFRHRKQG